MIKKDDLFGIVVWYNPCEVNLSATDSYVNEVNKLIIVDNSDGDNSHLIEQRGWANTIYLPNRQNKGIATALNQGCRLALEQGAQWVLTMDQDSFFDNDGVKSLIQKANQYCNFNKTAIFSPRHNIEDEITKDKVKPEYTIENDVMTSGNLLSLAAFQATGDFLDDFFIDLVDLEYCIRIKKNGFLIVMINDVTLHHFLGGGTYQTTFLGFKKSFYNHSPLRKYYIARNSLYVASLHKEQSKKYRKYLLKQIKKVVLYDNCNKWIKLRYMIKGILDYRKGIKGPYSAN